MLMAERRAIISILLVHALIIAFLARGDSLDTKPDPAVEKLLTKGQDLIESGKYDESLAYFDEAIEKAPANWRPYYHKGNALRCLEKYEEALPFLEKALELNPDQDASYVEMGKIYLMQAKLDLAEEKLKKALGINPSNQLGMLYLANCLEQKGDLEQARKRYEALIEVNASHVEALSGLASVYRKQNEPHKAIEYWNKVIIIKPDYAQAYFSISEILEKEKRFNLAIGYLNQGLKNDFKNLDAHKRLASILYYKKGRRRSALTHLEYGLSLEPENEEFLTAAGTICAELGRYRKAAEYYRRAAEVSKENAASYYYWAARGARLAGDYADALSLTEAGLAINSSSPGLHMQKGGVLHDMGKAGDEETTKSYQRALELLRKELEERPDSPDILLNISHAALVLHNNAEAKEAAAKVVRLYPNSAYAHLYLAASYAEENDRERTLVHVRKTLELLPRYGRIPFRSSLFDRYKNNPDFQEFFPRVE